eukprot:ANDGO_01255.mRNA.1 hypothetical protein SPRG_10787
MDEISRLLRPFYTEEQIRAILTDHASLQELFRSIEQSDLDFPGGDELQALESEIAEETAHLEQHGHHYNHNNLDDEHEHEHEHEYFLRGLEGDSEQKRKDEERKGKGKGSVAVNNKSFCDPADKSRVFEFLPRTAGVLSLHAPQWNALQVARNSRTHGRQMTGIYALNRKLFSKVSLMMGNAPELLLLMMLSLKSGHGFEAIRAIQAVSMRFPPIADGSDVGAGAGAGADAHDDGNGAQREFVSSFLSCGGFHVASRLVMNYQQLKSMYREQEFTIMMGELLALMKKSLMFSNYILGPDDPSASPELISVLYSIVESHQSLFAAACTTIEELLSVRGGAVAIDPENGVLKRIAGGCAEDFSIGCRLLAVSVFDHMDNLKDQQYSITGTAKLLSIFNSSRMRACDPATRNQSLVLAHDGLLKRVLFYVSILATQCSRTMHFMMARNHEHPLWSTVVFFPIPMSRESEWTKERCMLPYRPNNEDMMAFRFDLVPKDFMSAAWWATSNQFELLFLLGSLCQGRRRYDAVRKLTDLGIFDRLCMLMESIDWDPRHEAPFVQHLSHGPDCQCSADFSVKMQLLRLILAIFNDRDDSNMEVKRTPSCQRLVRIIAKTLKSLPDETRYRSSCAICLEAYLRCQDASLQHFVGLECGVIEYCLQQVCSESFKTADSLQPIFDLLSECLKFNPSTTDVFYHLCLENYGSISKLMQITKQHLIDSNVFLRGVLLSHEFLTGSRSKPVCRDHSSGLLVDGPASENFAAYLLRNREVFLADMMSRVTPVNVCQSNLCCMNTCLLFFVPLDNVDLVRRLWYSVPLETRKQYAELLGFWQEYYYSRAKDRHSLETSLRIPFGKWLRVVQLLMECAAVDDVSLGDNRDPVQSVAIARLKV